MDFIERKNNGKIVFKGTTREKLRRYYLKSFPYHTITQLFNEIVPEYRWKHFFPAEAVKKIVTELGLSEVETDIREIE